MFRFECCDARRKCKTFALAGKKSNTVLKIGICPKCNRISAVIETDGCVKVRRSGVDAYDLYNRNLPNILYEIKRIESGKNGWYLEYGEYGRKKKCYSNLRTLKLGLFDLAS